ncbi:MAG: hypothetical protein KJN66_09000 [Bacteroidia bacterium]|nr:hypothetical protein [Bacteroidia bacterium]
MKNLIKNSIVILVLFTTLIGNANEISSLRNLNDEKTTVLTLLNVKQGNQLFIKDVFGLVLYKEAIENSGEFVKGFDLTSLPNGKYYFELDKDLEIKVIPFKVSLNKVEFNKEKETTILKPYVTQKGNRVLVSKLSLSKQPLKVKIYYSNNSGSWDLIHSETIENTMNIQKAYKLYKKEKGNYKVILKTEGRSFIEYLKF